MIFLSEHNRFELRLPTETDLGVIAAETSPTTDPQETTESVESVETTGAPIAIETDMSLIRNTALAAIDRHAHVADPLDGTGLRDVITAKNTTADQSLPLTRDHPIHGGHEQNTDRNVSNARSLTFIASPTPLQLEMEPVLANGNKTRRRPAPLLSKLGATILKMIQIPWKTSLARCLHRCMVKMLPLFVRVAGVHTSPAPAP